ncbi:MAG TPA: alpha/beta hydrolase [Gemmatales bacterium]|nr:alpha/beta hydrolase [Gemmatales bacterium]HMP17328.1 alpha/beta hydrolase [Gemmatales bacterium]
MLQTELWNRNGLSSTPLSYCDRITHLSGYLARHLVIQNNQGASPIIVIPGLAGGMDFCLPFASRLSDRFAVHLVQPRGEDDRYALSPQTTLEQLGSDIVEYQKSTGLERPLLFGHGFGAIVALEAARQFPGRFAGVIVQGIAPKLELPIRQWLLEQLLHRASVTPTDLISPLFGQRWILPQLKEVALQCCLRTDLSVFTRRLELMSQFDMETFVDGLRTVPLLIQTATHDVFVSPEAWKPWRRLLPRMSLQTIDHGGHFAFLTQAELIALQIERFANRRLGMPLPTSVY